MLPSWSEIVSAKVWRLRETRRALVWKPTASRVLVGVTATRLSLASLRTAQEASSAHSLELDTRMRTTSSRNATICMRAAPSRRSIPLGSAEKDVRWFSWTIVEPTRPLCPWRERVAAKKKKRERDDSTEQ